jgi:diguanylate cyclase (GGDEF)-like protein
MRAPEQFGILLVDDDPTVIRILSHILSEFTPLRFATSGRLALRLARETVPDLVLLDVDMPELSGFEVCKQFKSDATLAQVPIIFITSHESPQLETFGLQLGAVDFISKPPHASLVLARVRTYQRLKMLSDTLRSAVKMDFLTGALTRHQLEKALTQEWLRARRSAAPLVLLLMDIDNFGAYNTQFGEEKGDACLRSVADTLRSAGHRPTDMLGRFEGGKFALLLPGTDAEGASTVAQSAIDAVDGLQMPYTGSTGSCHITLSVGGACLGCSRSSASDGGANEQTLLEGASPDDLIDAAERALQGARSAGGHQASLVDIASPSIGMSSKRKDPQTGEPENPVGAAQHTPEPLSPKLKFEPAALRTALT